MFFLPVQLKPSPLKPVLQVQMNEPAVFWQLALASHKGTEALHSSTSEINKVNFRLKNLSTLPKQMLYEGRFVRPEALFPNPVY